MNAIRLAGGQNRFEGRVEVCHNGQWKRVCIYGWFDQEANVVCRQLGFSGNLNRKKPKNIETIVINGMHGLHSSC